MVGVNRITYTLAANIITFSFLLLATVSCDTDTYERNVSMRSTITGPNPGVGPAPFYASDIGMIKHWMDECGCPWREQDVIVGVRQFACFDQAPYSGIPGHHVFVYEVHKTGVDEVFSARISKPPHFEKGMWLDFQSNVADSSLKISSDGIECLCVALQTL